MKKIVSLIMTALMVCAMLTAFAVPASAAGNLAVEEDTTISGECSYFDIDVRGKKVGDDIIHWKDSVIPCTLTVESGASVTCSGDLNVQYGCSITIKRGASVTCDWLLVQDGATVTIESGASVTCSSFVVQFGSTVTVKSGASVTCEELGLIGNINDRECVVTVENGASVTVSSGVAVKDRSFLDIGGTFSGKLTDLYGSVTLLPGGTADLAAADGNMANKLVAQLQQYDEGAKAEQNSDGSYRVTAHRHIYAEEGICCGAEHLKNTASTLSEGSMTVVLCVAAFALGVVGTLLVTKKKKPEESNS